MWYVYIIIDSVKIGVLSRPVSVYISRSLYSTKTTMIKLKLMWVSSLKLLYSWFFLIQYIRFSDFCWGKDGDFYIPNYHIDHNYLLKRVAQSFFYFLVNLKITNGILSSNIIKWYHNTETFCKIRQNNIHPLKCWMPPKVYIQI